ncbi:ATP-grasp domain-containing protein [Cereibacter sphaeroides]|uniref:ATP-grasp domain-containing protein n=1 Tax=Cereibacter sphaeroides TaxID=1063 RepID=UPI001F24F8D7|nr:ATP-grasp domain-containing protein [Cereibacter sphaeroides]MCE6957762.1 ATP-grasp domain-containing protein [Cereibacter sphaeroides]MCE6971612.1 ATP-grasp domain-containing protein [Cereibacter sphaeroides]
MTCVWFTMGLSNTEDAIRLLREHPDTSRYRIVASHANGLAARRLPADLILEEPIRKKDPAAYADWVIGQALREGVDLVVAQGQALALAGEEARFRAEGITLLVPASRDILDLLDDKMAFVRDLASAGVPTHAALPFRTLEEFDAALGEIRQDPRGRHGLCAKPVSGIYAAGFRRLREDDHALARILGQCPDGDELTGDGLFDIDLGAYRDALARSPQDREMMLMSYLPGEERSVDFTARDGRLVAAVARVKRGSFQDLETEGPAIDMARVLAARYRLNGQCNLQTRNCDGAAVPLEINPRMSGAMALSCLAGPNLPALAVLGALGHEPVSVPALAGGKAWLRQVPTRLD